jgi:hypothetical protein
VPSLLGVGLRMPLLHDGCAKTMRDRFFACATSGDGDTSHATAADLDDLIAYLGAL